MKCLNCNKEYTIPTEGNWKKDGTVGKGHGSIDSSKFCCFKCGQEYSQAKRKLKWKSAFNDPKVREKAKQTILDKYGCTNAFQSEEIKEKIKQTNVLRYGKENVSQVAVIREKIHKTNQERYGGTLRGSSIIKDKIKQTNIEKYGTAFPQQTEEIKDKIKATNLKRYGYTAPMSNPEVKEKSKQSSLEKYGVEWNCMTIQCKESSNGIISKINQQWQTDLEAAGLTVILEKNIQGHYAFDLYIPDQNLLIDINPTISHQSSKPISTFYGTIKPKDKYYHINKLQIAKDNNYNCIMIWDWDNKTKIIDNLKPKTTLYARNLIIKEVPEQDCNIFLNTFHYQNTCKNQTIRLGLYTNNNTLIQLMTFGKPRYNQNYTYELLRLCTHNQYKVIGGTQKLFKCFLSSYNPSSIISYCDNSKFNGTIYRTLGFSLISKGNPTKHWYNPKTNKHITNNLLLQRGFSQLHNDNQYIKANKYDNNSTLMLNNGYLEIFDCGQSSYAWHN